jgi:hypothetical protein
MDGSLTQKDGRSYPSRAMNYWLEKIRPDAMMRLWKQLGDSAKDVRHRISLERWVNGIMSGPGTQVAVTAYTVDDGFVLRFTEVNTSNQNGKRDERS